MLEISQTTTLLQLFCELLLYSKVILKSMRVADDTIYRISECEWVKKYSLTCSGEHLKCVTTCLTWTKLKIAWERPHVLKDYFQLIQSVAFLRIFAPILRKNYDMKASI